MKTLDVREMDALTASTREVVKIPPKSEKQRKLMWAVRNDPTLGKKLGISQAVAKEFTAKDRGGKLRKKKHA